MPPVSNHPNREPQITGQIRRRPNSRQGPELIWPGKHSLADRELVHAAITAPQSLELRLRYQRGSPNSGSAIVVGDNREVMRNLLSGGEYGPSLAGSVKLVYLDPPYNTGNQFSTYSDAKSSAQWLEDLRERLIQVRSLLTLDGSVWLHLDDSEQHHARAIMDEVFGREAFVATIIWQKRTTRDNRKSFSSAHDYIHVYAPLGPKDWKQVRNGLPDNGQFANPDSDPRGPWRSAPMSAQAGHATKSQFYSVMTPSGAQHDPPPGRCWTYTVERLTQLDGEGRVYWPKNGAGRPRLKRYASEATELAPSTLWSAEFAGDTSEAKKTLLKLFPGKSLFDTPKPERLISRIVSIATDPGDLVLDPYLGSGTTAIVALQNGRRIIGIEASGRVVEEIVAPRIDSSVDLALDGYSLFEAV